MLRICTYVRGILAGHRGVADTTIVRLHSLRLNSRSHLFKFKAINKLSISLFYVKCMRKCNQYTYIHMLNKNSLGLLKKGAAKQSRIKSIAWHLRWLVRTRADISLRPSRLVRPRTDIKLRPSAFVRTRTDFKLQTVGLGRSYKD